LLPIDQKYKFKSDGNPVFIDLLTSAISKESGDLKVSFRTGGSATEAGGFEWDYSIQAVAGKLKVISFPELGVTYSATFEGARDSTQEEFHGLSRLGSRAIVMSSRAGKVHAKFLFDLGMLDHGTVIITLTRGWVNPTGTPNLEQPPGN
jgi:hypothetical protein